MTSRRTPVRQQITRYLVTEVLPGLTEGSELPTISELCDRFGVSGVQTVRDGVEPLVAAGLVETRYRPSRRWIVRRPLHRPTPDRPDVNDVDELAAITEELAATVARLAELVRRCEQLGLRDSLRQMTAAATPAASVTHTLDDIADALCAGTYVVPPTGDATS